MKTAQKFFIECSHKNLSGRIDPIDLIKFARFYVKQALKAASDENNHPDAFMKMGHGIFLKVLLLVPMTLRI